MGGLVHKPIIRMNFAAFAVASYLLLTTSVALTGCGAGSQDTTGSSGTASQTATSLAIATDKTSIKSNNSDAATITVTAASSGNVVAPGVIVNFSADSGSLSANSATTDENGQAVVTIKSGGTSQTNRIITVAATADGLPAPVLIPIQVNGSSVSLATSNSVLVAGGTSATLTVTAVNANNVGVYNTAVALTVSPAGAVTLSPASGTTDATGQLGVSVSGITSGSAIVSVSALGATATQNYTISASGTEFKVTSPSADPAPLTTVTGSLAFTIQVGTAPITSVRLSSTIGTWTGCANGTGTSVCTVLASTPTATLVSNEAGLANVQVDGLDANGTSLVTDARIVAITSAASAANNITVQANVSVIPPSSGDTTNSANITATVRDANAQPVGNVPVVFTIIDSTGGGESLSPVLALSSDGTNVNVPLPGQAKTTFTSGSLPSGSNGIGIKATVVGTNISDTTRLNVGGTAGSIFIGRASKITVPDILTYALPMAALVADSNGNPVPGAVVSLSVWPDSYTTGSYYRITPITPSNTGTRYCATTTAGISQTTNTIGGGPIATFANEDINENLILDVGEDANGDGLLTPPNSSAGQLPTTVTADSNGIVHFDLTYLKQSAIWISVRLRARAFVQGSESTSSFTFSLPAEVSDVESCSLPDSPFQ